MPASICSLEGKAMRLCAYGGFQLPVVCFYFPMPGLSGVIHRGLCGWSPWSSISGSEPAGMGESVISRALLLYYDISIQICFTIGKMLIVAPTTTMKRSWWLNVSEATIICLLHREDIDCHFLAPFYWKQVSRSFWIFPTSYCLPLPLPCVPHVPPFPCLQEDSGEHSYFPDFNYYGIKKIHIQIAKNYCITEKYPGWPSCIAWAGDQEILRVNVCLAHVVWETYSNEPLHLPESPMCFCS